MYKRFPREVIPMHKVICNNRSSSDFGLTVFGEDTIIT